MTSRTRRRSRHLTATAVVVGLAVASCGSDSTTTDSGPGSVEPTVTEPIATDPPDVPATDPPETAPIATDPPETAPAPTDPPTTDFAGTAPDSVADDGDGLLDDGFVFDEEFFPVDEIDDVPVCRAYGRFFNQFVKIAFAGAFAGMEAELSAQNSEGGDAEIEAPLDDEPIIDNLVEQLEVVLYLDVADDAEVLREGLPTVMVEVLDAILLRAIAAPRIMKDAGFSDAEIALIIEASTTGTDPGNIDENDPRLAQAAAAMVAEFGPFFDALDSMEVVGAETEDEGTAFLESTCPKLAVLSDEFDL